MLAISASLSTPSADNRALDPRPLVLRDDGLGDGGTFASWPGPVMDFAAATPEILAAHRTVLLAPGDVRFLKALRTGSQPVQCEVILGWKRAGLLPATRLILATYKGRHLWTPGNDALVERWVVHARSERLVLDSERLAFVPLCLDPPDPPPPPGDDGYVFMGGRKWRVLDVGLAAMARAGFPGQVITDFAPEGKWAGVTVRREKIPAPDYLGVMARARVVLVPLRETPISHGHVEVVNAILHGRPLLVTAGASCDDYVEHGVNGLLVQGNSVEAWTEALREAWERAEAFGTAARERAAQYSTPRYAEHLRELVASLG